MTSVTALSRLFRRSVLHTLLALLAIVAATAQQPAYAADVPAIAVAANAQVALEEIAEAFQADTGLSVTLTFGSTGNFSRQIRQGAPFEMFVSADEDYVFDLAGDSFTRDKGALYGIGRIVLVVPRGSPLKTDGSLDDLSAALADGRLTRLAIANPDHAPYGRRAEEALRHKGLWDSLQSRLVFGENVNQAAQFATSANAQGGIIAYSLALSPNIAARAGFALIPAEWHAPLNQRMVLLNEAGATAQRFYAYVQTPPARAIFEKYGFALPDDEN